jgi:hypothetical protein
VRIHFDVLGWLHVSAGVFGVLTGASLAVLALGTSVALTGRSGGGVTGISPASFLLVVGVIFVLAGVVTLAVGRALVSRTRTGRTAALALAVPSLVVVPFGTALAVYSFWTLLNDDARREYER